MLVVTTSGTQQQRDAAGPALGQGGHVSTKNIYCLGQTFKQEVSHRATGNTGSICPAQMTFLLLLSCDSALCIFHLVPLQKSQHKQWSRQMQASPKGR